MSSISAIKILSYKLHGMVFRKKLIDVGAFNFFVDFPLLRVKWTYKKGNETLARTSIIYPANVYPYGRQTLEVVKEAAHLRYREGYSWYRLESRFYDAYNFSLNRIKRMLNRVELVFNRLISSRSITIFRKVSDWINAESRSFQHLTVIYRNQMMAQLFGDGHFVRDLFSP